MNNENSIRKFEYRPSRTTGRFDLEFVVEGKTILGYCKDVSEEGIRASLDGSVEVGGFGLVVFRHSGGVLELEAQVAYIDGSQVGLVFLFQTPWERGAINSLIASIQQDGSRDDADQGNPLVVPFNR